MTSLDSPERVQRWFETLAYNPANTMRTIVGVTKHHAAHCLEGAMAAAALLEPHGYPPLILDLESTDGLDHTLFLYRRRGRYGAIGKSRDIGLDGRKPVFRSIAALARSYVIPYIDAKAHITAYGVLDLRTLLRDWRTSTRNVWYVEDALRDIPHRRLPSSVAFVRRWRQRYTAFKKAHPDQQPGYFPRQETWA
ncbi:MAG: hypothetical protein HY975_00750 [Candidatus Kerfeldbacteria bacterium]|nr:hypothetical protein [Candidatus Kerfeldbacteria bacterium]